MDAWRQAAAALAADLKQRVRRTPPLRRRLRATHRRGRRGADHLSGARRLAGAELIWTQCARLAPRWERQHLATPLILPTEEFGRSLDAFPLEYGEILRAHERVFGGDPFDGASMSTRRSAPRVRDADQESSRPPARRVHRGGRTPAGDCRPRDHLRAGFCCAAPQRRTVERRTRIDRSRGMQRARAHAPPPSRQGIVVEILRLEHKPTIPMTDGARLFPDYLAAVEQLARVVDAWRL